jgi:GNAT superfamily N-acetyltransferase
MLELRLAQAEDVDAILAFDHLAETEIEREEFIRRKVGQSACYVAVQGCLLGYAVLEYTFFEQGFVSLLYVRDENRRSGVGKTLMQHLEGICRTRKLFTSTNLSNRPMQALLARLGYHLSGVIHDLDEGDPELVYVKIVSKTPQEIF